MEGLLEIKRQIDERLDEFGIAILPPMDVFESIRIFKNCNYSADVTLLDPWYNRGVGGVREDYVEFITNILKECKDSTQHLYLWGFPEIVALFIPNIPKPLQLLTWLTWYYKNNPSVIRGWRSSQQACLHIAREKAKVYPENFFNADQKHRFQNGKMRFVPGPPSVIEESLLVGFVGKNEQTTHPAQKPLRLYEKLLLMTTQKNDIVFDPMCGSGTAAEASLKLGLKCIISDISDDYIKICEERLGIPRIGSTQTFKNKNIIDKKRQAHQLSVL